MCSVPVRCHGGYYEVIEGLEVGDFAQSKLDITVGELRDERESVQKLELV
jgi:malate dehydrogenase